MKNFEYCKYTYIHRKIVMALVEKYVTNEIDKKEMIKRAEAHDMDKMVTYLFYDKISCVKMHRENNAHHLENNLPRLYLDYLEAIFDWESARYSKPDKPLNAYQTLYKYYPNYENEILPILKDFKLDSEFIEMDNDILKMAQKLQDEVTEEMILEEISFFLHNNK